jgi:predicted nucleic acid-binding protein
MSQLHRLEIEDHITGEVINGVRGLYRAKTLIEEHAERLEGSYMLEALKELEELEDAVTKFAEKLHEAQWNRDEVAELEQQFSK